MAAHTTPFPIHLPSPPARVGVALPVALSIGVHAALAALALWMQPAPAQVPQKEELVEITLLGGGMEPGPLGGGDGEEEEGPAIAQPAPPAPAPKVAAPQVAPPPPAPAPVEEPVVLAAAEEAQAEETITVAQVEEPTAEEPADAETPVVAADADRVDHLPKDRTLASLGPPPAGLGRGGGGGGGAGRGGAGSGGGGFGDGIVDVRHAVKPPKLLQQTAPDYPRVAKRRGIEGTVLLRLVLGKDGKVEAEHTQVLRSVPELDEAAIRAASQWRFSPALDGEGQPIRVALQLPMRFTLQ